MELIAVGCALTSTIDSLLYLLKRNPAAEAVPKAIIENYQPETVADMQDGNPGSPVNRNPL